MQEPGDGAAVTRQGPFWDVMQGRREPPPAALLLGFRLIDLDPDAGTIEVSFDGSERFLNPAGHVQGGFLAGELRGEDGVVVATATATAIIRRPRS